jgi:hypothetical protein
MKIAKKLVLSTLLGFFLLLAAVDIWGFLTLGTIVPGADQARDENANRVVMVLGATGSVGTGCSRRRSKNRMLRRSTSLPDALHRV